MFLQHGITVNKALLEGHPVPLKSLQLKLNLLWDLDFVLPEDIKLVVKRLKLGFSLWDFIL